MMKNTILITVLVLCSIGTMAQYDMGKTESFKRHNFGFGVNFGSFLLHKDYSEAVGTHGWMTDIRVTSAFVWNVLFKYEYMFNKKFFLSVEAGYTNQRLEVHSAYQSAGSVYTDEYSKLGIHQLYVPIMANYCLRMAGCANFLMGAGVNATLAFKDKFETKDLTGNVGVKFKNAVDMDFVLRAGFEIENRHRMQINATYMVSPMSNLEFFRGGLSNAFADQEGDRVSRLVFGFTIFYRYHKKGESDRRRNWSLCRLESVKTGFRTGVLFCEPWCSSVFFSYLCTLILTDYWTQNGFGERKNTQGKHRNPNEAGVYRLRHECHCCESFARCERWFEACA